MTRYLEAGLPGGSRSRLFADEQGRQYVVKLKENPQGLRILVNELVSNALAQVLHVPSPRGFVVQIAQGLIDPNKLVAGPGEHFGTEYLGRDYQIASSPANRAMIAKVSNLQELPSVVILDIVTLNHDRNNDGNYLIMAPASAPSDLRFAAIDHGHCFGGPAWDRTLPTRVGTWPPSLIPELLEQISGTDPFVEPLNRLRALADTDIDAIVDGVPSEWLLSADEAGALKAFLKGQMAKAEDLLLQHKHLFPHWG
jgi:hypothetical protein